jgi:amino acid adenylation domain-containing protein/non-ribosomal peptide synthase protein (TIGR01720 family)
MAANPEARLVDLALLAEAERQQVLIEWNGTRTPFPREACIHERFRAQAARTPDATATVFEDRHLTYAGLACSAGRLAHRLAGLGVVPETAVGICLERSPEMVVGMLGVLEAGGAYVPLDPRYPPERLAFMLDDSGAAVILTRTALAKGLPARFRISHSEFLVPIVCLDDGRWLADGEERGAGREAVPRNLSYVIYTSGSTGIPKGTLLEHGGLCNLAQAQVETFDIRAGSRVLQFASICFDASVSEIFATLLAGGTLCLAAQESLLPGRGLVELLRDEAITVVTLPPSVLASLPGDGLKRLVTLVSAGEACTAEVAARWAGGRRFINAYGPTEGTVCATLAECAGRDTPPIGRPLANVSVYLVDRELRPVPVGVPGELFIGGAGVGRGYRGRPALTAERFVPDPFGEEPGARLYRTGDLARYLPDGNVEFLGRIDYQVKVRGFRVEPEEIEATLVRHPGVRQAVVLAREDEPGARRLVAYVVPDGDRAPAAGDLGRFVRERLPDYMVPARFVTLEILPLTPGGKIDRGALPAPDGARPEVGSAFVAPRTSTERALAEIWVDVLGLDRVGVHDSFFELGGDSILSLQIIARAARAGLRLTPRQFFERPTIAGLAAVAEVTTSGQAEQGAVTGPVPLTPIQHWFFEQNLAEPHHWNQSFLLEVRGRLDPTFLERSVAALSIHHDVLRSRFRKGEAGWEQSIADPDCEAPFVRIDLSTLPEMGQRGALEALAAALQASLGLEEGPLVRVASFDMGDGRPDRLLIVAHHLVVDGVSWRILLEDLQSAYSQLERGEAVTLPPKTTAFQHWARQLETYARSEDIRQEIDHWLGAIGEEEARLPVDGAGGENTQGLAHAIEVELDEEETQALLREVPAAYGAEIDEALLAAVVQAFEDWTGSRSLLVDLERHGRENPGTDVDVSRTVGWFTSLHPLRLALGEARGPGDALRAVKEQLRGTPRRGFGYGLLRYLGGDGQFTERLQTLPRPEVVFNYLGRFDQFDRSLPFEPAQESPGPSCSARGRRSHLIGIDASVAAGRLRVRWSYGTRAHREETVARLAGTFIKALREIIAHCRSPGAVGYTPSDFPDLDLCQDDVEALLQEVGQDPHGE